MTKVFNGTPHAINVVEGATFNSSIRKYTGGTVVLSIPSNGMLNAKITAVDLPAVEFSNLIEEPYTEAVVDNVTLIPVFGKSFSGVDPLPEGHDIYIVSAMYASAAQKAGVDMSKIFTVADPVYSEDGNSFIGCRGICPAF